MKIKMSIKPSSRILLKLKELFFMYVKLMEKY